MLIFKLITLAIQKREMLKRGKQMVKVSSYFFSFKAKILLELYPIIDNVWSNDNISRLFHFQFNEQGMNSGIFFLRWSVMTLKPLESWALPWRKNRLR